MAESEQPVLSALGGFFATPTKPVTFIYVSSGNRNQYKDTWSFVREEKIMVGQNQINTLVFSRVQEGMLANNFVGRWTHWLDPVTRIWIKHEVQVTSGYATGINTPGMLKAITKP